jgi:hypothetical protein
LQLREEVRKLLLVGGETAGDEANPGLAALLLPEGRSGDE